MTSIVDYVKFKLFREKIKYILRKRIYKNLGAFKVNPERFIFNGQVLKDSKNRDLFVAFEDYKFVVECYEKVFK